MCYKDSYKKIQKNFMYLSVFETKQKTVHICKKNFFAHMQSFWKKKMIQLSSHVDDFLLSTNYKSPVEIAYLILGQLNINKFKRKQLLDLRTREQQWATYFILIICDFYIRFILTNTRITRSPSAPFPLHSLDPLAQPRSAPFLLHACTLPLIPFQMARILIVFLCTLPRNLMDFPLYIYPFEDRGCREIIFRACGITNRSRGESDMVTDHSAMPLPIFRYCTTSEHFDIPFPDRVEVNLGPWEDEFESIKKGSQVINWENKYPYAYWKGNPYVNSPTREKLLTCNDTNKWKAQILRENWGHEISNGFKHSKLSSQCDHRYKIYAEGYAWSVSLKYILACGCVPLIINPQYEDFLSRGLFPKEIIDFFDCFMLCMELIDRQAVEAVDRSIQDITKLNLPFGGKIMILGGDFRQVLPVLRRGTRAQIIQNIENDIPLEQIYLKNIIKY
ncbi:hypothetical protein LXL04_033580 [Taraxacum kok-saghyz]